MRVALVYDRVNKWGGAERVLLALHKIFPKAPLFTSVYNPKTAPWAKVFNVKTSFLQLLPLASKYHEIYAPLMPLAFQSFAFKGYDIVISVTSEAAKCIITDKNTYHICYCLTPTRYLWSGYKEYFKNSLFKIITLPIVWCLRVWDRKASARPDLYIAISKEVKRRIKRYYKRDALVVYPPVFSFSTKGVKKNHLSGYFLIVSRLVPYKRIDIAIKACNLLNLPLIIIGKGVEEKRLKKLAGQYIFFLKNLTDEELVGYYKNCKALLFPGREDFGLSIVEAQSFGKPVIAYKSGGALEIIKEGKTGVFFGHQIVKSLLQVLNKFDEKKFKAEDCIRQANQFSFELFEKQILVVIKKQAKKKTI